MQTAAESRACFAIERALPPNNTPPYSALLSTVASNTNWAKNHAPALNNEKLKAFLLTRPDRFRVIADKGPGNDSVQLIQPPLPASVPPVPPPINEDDYLDLCRPFDTKDGFYALSGPNYSTYQKLLEMRATMWLRARMDWFRNFDETQFEEHGKNIFDQAFCKCVRLSIRIAYVPSDADSFELRRQLSMFIGMGTKLYLFKQKNDESTLFSRTFATMWCPGRGVDTCAAVRRVADALSNGSIVLNGRKCALFNGIIGCSPGETVVKETIEELIGALSEPGSPVAHPTHTAPPTSTREQLHTLLGLRPFAVGVAPKFSADPPELTPTDLTPTELAPAHDLWPVTFAYDATSVVSLNNPIIVKAVNKLRRNEIALRQRCQEEAALPEDDRKGYACKSGVEWIFEEDEDIESDFLLGHGAEANVYLGLLQKQGNDEKRLVAVKLNHAGKSQFNSEEREHMICAGVLPGIVTYHDGFTLKANFGMKQDVLVQDVGITNLRQLVNDYAAANRTADGSGALLPEKDRFSVCKAACLAVAELHKLVRTIIHRDIRPENVLIMSDGTLCLTDFGLARKKSGLIKGSSMYTQNLLTTMQPYEVQQEFRADMKGKKKLPIRQHGDIFMLGCVLAFVHLGRDPFADVDIMNSRAPNLGELATQNPWLHHLLTCMLNHDLLKRPTIDLVLRHPYFTKNSSNFDGIIRIERDIVCDFKGNGTSGPVDDDRFKILETMLRPIEEKLAKASERGDPWHSLIPQIMFHNFRLPFSTQPIRFMDINARAYPLPEVARLAKWLRNICTHFHADINLQNKMRMCKGGKVFVEGVFYDTPGDFWIRHPAVSWLCPLVWEQSVRALGDVALRRQKLATKFDEDVSALDAERSALLVLLQIV
jgi:serine/threonine protein kinase